MTISSSLLGVKVTQANHPSPIPSGHIPTQISRTPVQPFTQSAPSATQQATPSATQQPTQSTTQQPVLRQISTKQSQVQMAKATGTGTATATQATATLGFYDQEGSVITYTAGTVFTNDSRSGNTMQIVLDAAVTVSGGTPGNTSFTAPAHAVVSGASGNVAAGGVWNDTDHGGLGFSNTTPFTGGRDAQNYIFVQQSDIDGAASPLKTTTTQQASNGLQSQLNSNEHLIGSPLCTSAVTSNHAVNDKAATVTVTVATTCTETAST